MSGEDDRSAGRLAGIRGPTTAGRVRVPVTTAAGPAGRGRSTRYERAVAKDQGPGERYAKRSHTGTPSSCRRNIVEKTEIAVDEIERVRDAPSHSVTGDTAKRACR